MRTKTLFLLVICCANVAFAQIEVASNWNVGIGLSSNTTPLSPLTVGGWGNTSAFASIFSLQKTYGLMLDNAFTSPAEMYGIYATALNTSGKCVGLQGVGGEIYSYVSELNNIGVRGIANHQGYGVSGLLVGVNGAGIYGGIEDLEVPITGSYAGYFNGNVRCNGNVGIGLSSSNTATPLSTLSVGGAGDASAKAFMTAYNLSYALKIHNEGYLSEVYGIYGTARSMTAKAIAIQGIGGDGTGLGIGVRGIANVNSGGYGVSGLYNGTNGTGIYGGTGTIEVPISGLYAGYFNGDVKVIGTVNGTTIGTSDIRYKKDILELDPEKSLKNILMMKPVEYRLEQQYVETVVSIDTLTREEFTERYPVYDETSQLFQKKHYGLIAQELQELYPDLDYETNNEGYLGINYTEIIPMLIQSIQELHREIEILKNPVGVLKDGAVATDVAPLAETTSKALLYQNTPNPFNEQTEIRYELPATIRHAFICIFDMQGKM